MNDDYPTLEQLSAAVRVLMQCGVIPEHADEETTLRNWDAVKKALFAAKALE